MASRAKYFFIFLLIFFYSSAFAQSEINPEKIKEVRSQKLTFLWPGNDCPDFKNTYELYGFKIAVLKYNKKVVKKLNRIYGEDWFYKNVESFIKKRNNSK
jgi:hypothetical protein